MCGVPAVEPDSSLAGAAEVKRNGQQTGHHESEYRCSRGEEAEDEAEEDEATPDESTDHPVNPASLTTAAARFASSGSDL